MVQAKIPEIGRFAVVGLINFAIDVAVFSIALYVLGIPLLVANTLAYSLATINSYLMNKYWTFAGRSDRNISTAEFTRFLLFNVGGLALSNLTVFLLAEFLLPLIAKLGAVGVTFVWNYLTIRRFVFRDN
jgi:putative flippase GtrA